MKSLILITALFMSGLLYSQSKPHLKAISLTKDTTVLFRGFENHFQLITNEKDKNMYSLIGSHCTISKLDNKGNSLPENEFIIKAMDGNEAKIKIVKKSDSGLEVAETVSYSIANLPVPIVHIDNVVSGNTLGRDIRLIEVKFDDVVAPEIKYDITGWTLLIDGAIYTGNNYMPTEDFKAQMKALPSGTKIDISVECREREGGHLMRSAGSFTVE